MSVTLLTISFLMLFPFSVSMMIMAELKKLKFSPENEKLIRSYQFFTTEEVKYGYKYIPIEINNDFENFVCKKLCVCGGNYIKTNCSNHKDGMAEINYFMAHREVYEMMLREAGGRIPYNKDKTYAELLKDRYMKVVDKYKANAELCAKTKAEMLANGDEDKAEAFSDVFIDFEIDMLTDKIFCAAETLSPAKRWWKVMAREYLDNGNEAIIDEAVNKTLFNLALSMHRNGYLCASGMGGQSQETKMHYVVAQFVIKHIAEYAEKMKEYCDEEDLPNPTGVEETIFFWGD